VDLVVVVGAVLIVVVAFIGIVSGVPIAGYIVLSFGLLIWGIRKLVTRYERGDALLGVILIVLSIGIYTNAARLPQWHLN
jgi:hypothetical protein